MTENRDQLLPAYVMADESGSMRPHQGELAAGLASLCEGLRAEPMIAAKIRLAILGFSGDVQVRQELSDMRTVTDLPQLQSRGLTSYKSAFLDLKARIPQDIGRLKSEEYGVHRPVVFFLSDGAPTDRWSDAHSSLTDRNVTPGAPNIIACGIGDAQAKTMVEVATRKEFAFVSVPGADIGQAISEFFQALTQSLVASGRAMANGSPELVVQRPDQFRLAIEEV